MKSAYKSLEKKKNIKLLKCRCMKDWIKFVLPSENKKLTAFIENPSYKNLNLHFLIYETWNNIWIVRYFDLKLYWNNAWKRNFQLVLHDLHLKN